ncbi:MAG: hypothetical protein MJY59_05945 [Bacteroidaceae bacterium]|nr:hypothetical protein [Bacteroidaceae bacterium]
MHRTINVLFIAIITAILVGCGGDCRFRRDELVASAVRRQMVLYPGARLQDIYKAFFQARFGPEHMIADTASAGAYLDSELCEADNSAVVFEPIGTDSAYYRVHLRAVHEGLMSRDELLSAFVRSAHRVGDAEIDEWRSDWADIVRVIDGMGLGLVGMADDERMIDSVLSSGRYAVHHSEHFGRLYKPHYRIVRKELVADFMERQRLLP